MSRAERFALMGALLLVLLQAAGSLSVLGESLEYRRAALYVQPWRALTGHWVHINWPHALINAAAWVIVARLFATELASPRQQWVVVASASVGISVGLALAYPQIEWYRGFSGVLHALFFAGATIWLARAMAHPASRTLGALWLPGALVLGGWLKVLLEQPAAGVTPYAGWLDAATVPQAHLLGAACGTVIGLLFARARPSAALAKARQEDEQTKQK